MFHFITFHINFCRAPASSALVFWVSCWLAYCLSWKKIHSCEEFQYFQDLRHCAGFWKCRSGFCDALCCSNFAWVHLTNFFSASCVWTWEHLNLSHRHSLSCVAFYPTFGTLPESRQPLQLEMIYPGTPGGPFSFSSCAFLTSSWVLDLPHCQELSPD